MNGVAAAIAGLGAVATTLYVVTRPSKCIYLDANATTPASKAVMREMERVSKEVWANPHSTHGMGKEAAEVVKKARRSVAHLLGANSDEVYFSSGATEGINLAIRGVLCRQGSPQGQHVVTSSIEHPAVLNTLRALEKDGTVELTIVDPANDGIVSSESIMAAIRPDTALVAVMWANNEMGAIQPIRSIASKLADHPAKLLVDATQSVAFVPPELRTTPIDLLVMSGHKIYGPKGIGALFVRRGLQLNPSVFGGGQQQGVRPGTLAPALIAGLGVASDEARTERTSRSKYLLSLQREFLDVITDGGVESINGPKVGSRYRLPNNLSLVLAYQANAVIKATPSVAFSSGSACSCGRASHVLKAIGLTDDQARRTIRIGLGSHLSKRDVRQAARSILETLSLLGRIHKKE